MHGNIVGRKTICRASVSIASSSDVSSGGQPRSRSKEKGEEVGEVAPGDPRLLLSTLTRYRFQVTRPYRYQPRGCATKEIKRDSFRTDRERNFRVDFHYTYLLRKHRASSWETRREGLYRGWIRYFRYSIPPEVFIATSLSLSLSPSSHRTTPETANILQK